MRIRRLALACGGALVAALLASPAQAATTMSFQAWSTGSEFSTGTLSGTKIVGGSVQLGTSPYRTTRAGRTFVYGGWTSPWHKAGFAAKALVPSWNASTPGDTFVKVQVRLKNSTTTGSWDTVATYAHTEAEVQRTSHSGQSDDLARVDTDTLITASGKLFSDYQVKVVLYRPAASTSAVSLRSVHATASTFLTRSSSTSPTTMTATKELAVPRFSQMIHVGHKKAYGGGGEAWCSPTSMAMVLRYFGRGPTGGDIVDFAAVHSYDFGYDGTGNWAFSTAYGGQYADGFVTRLADLRDAEAFIKAGIPLVASIKFSAGGLTGSPLTSTDGHLLVIAGFAADGRVITNDPAAPSNTSVRRVYNRAQFEDAWQGGSGGIVYVIRPSVKALPSDTARW